MSSLVLPMSKGVLAYRCAAQDDPQKTEQDFAAADPQFAELKQKYDRSRRTVTRTGEGLAGCHFFWTARASLTRKLYACGNVYITTCVPPSADRTFFVQIMRWTS